MIEVTKGPGEAARIREHVFARGTPLQLHQPQRLERLANERQGARLAVLGFRDNCLAGFQVDHVPSQVDELAAPCAGRDREDDEGVQLRPFRLLAGLKERVALVIREESSAAAGFLFLGDVGDGDFGRSGAIPAWRRIQHVRERREISIDGSRRSACMPTLATSRRPFSCRTYPCRAPPSRWPAHPGRRRLDRR